MRRLPYIITDIDGVLLRGKNQIDGTAQALQLIKQMNIPFCCLTNGGGCTEQVKANRMNALFKFDGYFSKDNVILNHTPLKKDLVRESKKGPIIITGSHDVVGVVNDLEINNFVTADELFTLGLARQPQFIRKDILQSGDSIQAVLSRIEKRNIGNLDTLTDRIQAIFALNDVSPYETSLATIMNIFEHRIRSKQRVPNYYTSQNDILWASAFPLSRIAMGPFNYILIDKFKKYLHHDFQPIVYGKPTLKAFKYVEQYMRDRYPGGGTFYMIGDNPRADIRGANTAGWVSILTRTGVFKGTDNDYQDPAKIVVNNFSEAIREIIKIQAI